MKAPPFSVSEVLDSLERAPAIVLPLVNGIPAANRKRRPSPDIWSAHEHAVHLAEVHPIFFARLERMLDEEKPAITPYDPGKDDREGALLEKDLDESLARFRDDRAALVERLRGLNPDQWQREASHPEYSPYTIAIMFRHLALHDFLHAYRIEELAFNPRWTS